MSQGAEEDQFVPGAAVQVLPNALGPFKQAARERRCMAKAVFLLELAVMMLSSHAVPPVVHRAPYRAGALKPAQMHVLQPCSWALASCLGVVSSQRKSLKLKQSAPKQDCQDFSAVERFERLKRQQEALQQKVKQRALRKVPRPWRAVEHPSEPGKVYFYNEETGETRWELPQPSAQHTWRKLEDAAQPGRFYYHNEATGETRWDLPQELNKASEEADASEDASEAPEELPSALEEASKSSAGGVAARLLSGEAKGPEPLSAAEAAVAAQQVDGEALAAEASARRAKLEAPTEIKHIIFTLYTHHI